MPLSVLVIGYGVWYVGTAIMAAFGIKDPEASIESEPKLDQTILSEP